jgi:hypothetical protein
VRSFDEIVQLVKAMQQEQGPTLLQMRAVLDRYEGDWVLPVPQVPNEPTLPPLTPQLMAEAVDNLSMRAASVRPNISCPAIDPIKDTGARSREYAMTRKRILAATYTQSKWQLGLRRFFRQLTAYHTGSILVYPDFKNEIPRIATRDPLATFVEPRANDELRPPEYAAFITRYSGDSLRRMFPKVRGEAGGPVTADDTWRMWDVVEWHDCEQILWGLCGPVEQYGQHVQQSWVQSPWMQLSPTYPNRAGRPTVVAPTNVSLGKIISRLATLTGNVDLQAKMMALTLIAHEKAIFPDVYVIGRQSGNPQIVGGQWKDGREGDVNMLMDVEAVGMLRTTPDPGIMQITDRLERNFRTSTGLVPQFGGETYGALRTGRGIDALAGIAVDPRVQEMHEIAEAWLPHMNEAIFDVYKGYWGNKKYSMSTGWAGDDDEVDFVPNKHIETTSNTVSYVIPGADVIQQTQILGSLFGANAISARTFRQKHPWIDDPEREGRIIDEEKFEEALKQSLFQQMLQGAMDPMMAVLIRNHMQQGHDIFAAVEWADQEAKRRQATEAPPAPEGMVAAPEAMPGMTAGPGALQQPLPPDEAAAVAGGDQVAVPQGAAAMRELMQVMGG